MSKLPKPLGFYVLVKVREIEEKSESGIILHTSSEKAKEEYANSVAEVLDIGPLAFKEGFNDCNGPEDWGVAIGDIIEFISYEGKISCEAETNELRYIIDKQILGKIK